MPDYTKGLIYKITTGDDIYVGSCCDFNERKRDHRFNTYNENCNEHNFKLYTAIRENNGQFDMELLHQFPCNSDVELRKEEQRVMNELKPTLNMRRAYVTREEIREDRKHHNINKELKSANYKRYRLKNYEKVKAKEKKRYDENREEILKRQRIRQSRRVNCPFCNKEMRYGNLSDHKKKWCKSIE